MKIIGRNSFFHEALTLLNKAIKEDKSEPGLYINRGGKSKLRNYIHVYDFHFRLFL